MGFDEVQLAFMGVTTMGLDGIDNQKYRDICYLGVSEHDVDRRWQFQSET